MRQQKPATPEFMRDRAREHRKESTQAERKLWRLLRDRRLDGLKFRREQVIGRYIADFFCAEARLVAETDGLSHDGRAEPDVMRAKELEELGYRVLRFLDKDVMDRTNDVMEAILKAARNAPGC